MKPKHLFYGVAIAMGLSTAPLRADAVDIPAPSYFVTGKQYRELPTIQKTAYVEGTLDGWAIAVSIEHDNKQAHALGLCIRDMGGYQAQAIVDAYIAQRPAQWDWPMSMLIHNAFGEACKDRGAPLS